MTVLNKDFWFIASKDGKRPTPPVSHKATFTRFKEKDIRTCTLLFPDMKFVEFRYDASECKIYPKLNPFDLNNLTTEINQKYGITLTP